MSRFPDGRCFERIHRSNLVGIGVRPLQFKGNDRVQFLGIKGDEQFHILGIDGNIKPQQDVTLDIEPEHGETQEVKLLLRVDTSIEVDCYKNGGILPYVMRGLLHAHTASTHVV